MGPAAGKYEEVKVSCPFIHLNCSSPADKSNETSRGSSNTGYNLNSIGLSKAFELKNLSYV